MSLLIKQATLVNENQQQIADVLIEQGKISKIATQINSVDYPNAEIIDATGLHLLPGMIDDQVHFREPGLTHKGNIASESRAAIAGGTTSFMEMPNVNPPSITLDALEQKYQIAAETSWANYSFYLGATNDNIEQIKQADPKTICGIKIFMGSSTGNMLVDQEAALREIFSHSPMLIATHCEDTPMIIAQEQKYHQQYGDAIPMHEHPNIRCREACYKSSSFAVDLAKQTGARLHILHITTADELALFEPGLVTDKQITAEACVHHLWFSEADYETQGGLIKCNPAIKTSQDRDAIRQALIDGKIDVIATDHAPHTLEEKNQAYSACPSGLPQVQKSLVALLDLYHQGVFSLEMIVEKTSHNVARLFEIEQRGFIRENYWADLVLIDLNQPHTDNQADNLYHCQWSPWEGHTFKSSVIATIVNGKMMFNQGKFADFSAGQRLLFNR